LTARWLARPLKVFVVPDEAPASTEAMGTKSKFWFSRSGEMWLYKVTRPGSGEHWAEVLAAALAEMLGLPHARTSSRGGATRVVWTTRVS
jgi:hypothetical protein